MIGHVIMEIEADEMIAAIQFSLNREVFYSEGSRVRHKANVVDVRQRSNGNFSIEFNGWSPVKKEKQPDGTDDIS